MQKEGSPGSDEEKTIEQVTPGEDTLTLDDLAHGAELVEVYRTDNAMAADVVVEQILGTVGITAYKHDRRSNLLPAPVSMPGEIGVAVPAELAESARIRLREARADGVLMDDGHLVEEIGDEDEEGGTGVA